MDCKILEVRDVDVSPFSALPSLTNGHVPAQIVLAKLLEPGPVLVLMFQAQQVTVKSREVEGQRVVEDVSGC